MLAQYYLTLRLRRLNPSDQWAPEREGLSFIFPRAGAGKYLSGKSSQQLVPGDVLLVKGGDCGKVSGDELVFCWFSVSVEHLFPLFAGHEIPLLQSVAAGLRTPKLYRRASPLAVQAHRLVAGAPAQFNLDHRSELLRVAAVLLSDEFKAAPGEQRCGFVRPEEHAVQVLEKLARDEFQTMPVGRLAKHFACSERQLNRLFHQLFGRSVAALRMELRLIRAASLLRNPKAKVSDIAECCGFNHLGHFHTCFKRRFGDSPARWRKRHAGSETQSAASAAGFPCSLHAERWCPCSSKVLD